MFLWGSVSRVCRKILSKDGLHMSQQKIDSCLNFPFPQTHKELKGVLGLFNYFRDFVPGQSVIARPLNDLYFRL